MENRSWSRMSMSIIIGALFFSNCGNNEARTKPLAQSFDYENSTYPFTLPGLPYAYDGLEPHIDARTMKVHHSKHHKAYIDKLNAALANYENLQKKTLRSLLVDLDELPAEIREEIQNQGGGTHNHALFWILMNPNGGGEPTGNLAQAITDTFGSFDEFKEKFNEAAKKVFGSGWAWLCIDNAKKLVIIATPNQNSPLSGGYTPLLGLDVWEHAYYLKFENERPDYIDAWWNVVNWTQVEVLYMRAMAQ